MAAARHFQLAISVEMASVFFFEKGWIFNGINVFLGAAVRVSPDTRGVSRVVAYGLEAGS